MSRIDIEHSFEGTTATFEKDDLIVRGIVKAAGFRWSGRLGAWYLNRSWGEPTRRARVQQVMRQFEEDEVELVDGGRAPQTTAAEREEQARERAAERAERMEAKAEKLAAASNEAYERQHAIGDRIPMGQPVLVDHYSARRHLKDIDRMRSLMTKSVELDKEATAAARSAAIAARAADGTPIITRQRRIERKSAELRKMEKRLAEIDLAEKLHSRGSPELVAKAERLGIRKPSPGYRERIVEFRDQLADEIAHDQAVIDASGVKVYSKADVSKGDVVIAHGRPRKVVRVNAKSVSVETGYSWTDTVPYIEITRVIAADAA